MIVVVIEKYQSCSSLVFILSSSEEVKYLMYLVDLKGQVLTLLLTIKHSEKKDFHQHKQYPWSMLLSFCCRFAYNSHNFIENCNHCGFITTKLDFISKLLNQLLISFKKIDVSINFSHVTHVVFQLIEQ